MTTVITQPPWRNWLARSAVNRKVGGSSPPGGAIIFTVFLLCFDKGFVIFSSTCNKLATIILIDKSTFITFFLSKLVENISLLLPYSGVFFRIENE